MFKSYDNDDELKSVKIFQCVTRVKFHRTKYNLNDMSLTPNKDIYERLLVEVLVKTLTLIKDMQP